MRNIKGRYFALAGTLAVAGGLAFAVAPAAHATTVACQNGFGDQCGTFSSQNLQAVPHDVFWDVKGTTALPNVPVIGYGANSPSDKATDFVKVLHIGVVPTLAASNSTTKSYSIVYTPNGHWSNLCVADTGTHKLTLRTCNGGQFQRYIAEQTTPGAAPKVVGVALFNGDRIRDNGNGSNPFGLRNVAYGTYVQDTSTASSFGPAAVPDTRQLVDAGVSTFQAHQLWFWLGGAS
jgi:hypothetical protein